MGIRPSRWAMYSSFRTVELSWNSTRSMARVGTSPIIMRRRVLAMLVSVSDRMKRISCGARSRTCTLGNLWWGILAYVCIGG